MKLQRPSLYAFACLLCAGACSRCASGGPSVVPDSAVNGDGPRTEAGKDDGAPGDGSGTDAPAGWKVLYQEDFENLSLPTVAWRADDYPDDGPFSDNGAYFTKDKSFGPPTAYRSTHGVSRSDWLTIEAYSRRNDKQLSDLVQVVTDPAGGSNKVLRLASPDHTDATVLRPSQALPSRYRVSLRVGFASFGNGAGQNGYDGDERAEPWRDASATTDNGFYWLAILDALPRPHNNIWIHHHRKVVVDSDNHHPAWTEIWDGSEFVESGVHPVMVFGLDGLSEGGVETGKQFIAYSAGAWQREAQIDAIRAANAYKANTWYRVSIERSGDQYTLEVSGDFQYGGQQTYRASTDAAERCLWHYNRPGETARAKCIDATPWPPLGSEHPRWPADQGWPDYFMLGDPHNNYYEGSVHYDDLKLEVWK